MKLNVSLLRRRLARLRMGRSIDIKSLAAREWVLCPEETVVVPPALYLDGAIERIKALSPWRSWNIEMLLVNGGTVHHAASRAHLIEKVDLVGAFLYAGAARANPGYGREELILRNSPQRRAIPTANLISNNAGSHFFGNYLLDDFPLALLAENSDENISMVTKSYEHEPGYRELLSLRNAPLVQNARIEQLILYTDFAQNSLKASRYQVLRSRMQNKFAGATAKPGVYIKRGRTGELRALDNELEIEQLLDAVGFDIIEPARLSAEEIARRTLGAPIVVSVEGSHLSHAIFTVADGGTFLVLQPPDRFAMPYKEFTDRLEMRFAFLVGNKTTGGFMIPPNDVRRMLDRLM